MTSDRSTADPLPDLVSVIMPVRNGADVIGHQISALLEQTYEAPWELVVVDNGSTDDSVAVVEAKLERSRPRCLVRAEVLGYVESFGHASPRNHGVAASAGSWLVFCDADDAVAPDWLGELVASRTPGTVTASRFVTLSGGDAGDDEGLAPDESTAELFGVPVIHTGGMLVARTDFDALGGFDSDFDRGGADVDFSIRAYAAGMKAAIATTAVYRVRGRDMTSSAIGQAYRYGRSRVRLFARHRDVVPEPQSEWSLLFRRMRDVIRRSPELLSATKRTPYLRMASNVAARLIWSARLRVRYF